MTGPSVDNLSRAKIRRLLAAVGSAHTPDGATPQAAEYDWRDPHYFNEQQHNQLAAVMSQVAARVAERLTHFQNCEFTVVPASITQHFAGALGDVMGPGQSYGLTFGPDHDTPRGVLAVGDETALKWVTQLLGDSESDGDSDRALSSLEESLLCDLTTGVVEAFLTPLRSHHDFRTAPHVVKGDPNLQLEQTEEMCRIAFQITKTDSNESDEVLFVLPCRVLEPLVGQGARTTPAASAPDELSRVLMEHVQQMPVTITARLASTLLNVEQLLDLGSDDVLLLNRTIDAPVDLIVDDRVLFRARPAQSNGRYAMFVTESVADSSQERSTPAATN